MNISSKSLWLRLWIVALIPAWLGQSPLLAAEADGAVDCVIEPSAMVEIASPVAGIVEVIKVERNQLVQRGQEVARLDARVEQAAVALARARAEREAGISLAKTRLAYKRRVRARLQEVYTKDAIPLRDKDEADTEAAISELELEVAREERELARLALQRAQELLDRKTIRSSIDGVVTEVLTTPGEYVEEDPLLKVARVDPLYVEAILPVSMLGLVHKDMVAQVTLESPVATSHIARVTIVDRVLDAASGTFGVRLEIPNSDYGIPAGLRCEVRFARSEE